MNKNNNKNDNNTSKTENQLKIGVVISIILLILSGIIVFSNKFPSEINCILFAVPLLGIGICCTKLCSGDFDSKPTNNTNIENNSQNFNNKSNDYLRLERSISKFVQETSTQNIPTCPTCHSTNIKKISTTKKAAGFAMVGLLSSNLGKTFECKNCGYKW